MWISEAEAKAMDRDELAKRATALAREALPGVDIEIVWRGMWVRRVGADFFPDPDIWKPAEPNWQRWSGMAQKFVKDAADYWFHVYKPSPGDVIVDIGAGRGEDVYAFSRAVGGDGRVWGVEPHPVSFETLSISCELNRLDNARLFRYACVEETEPLQIETMPVWESNYVRRGGASADSYAVEGIPFDELCERHGIDRIDFLKMNIEGAERHALPGCRKALERARFVCVAAHDFRAARGEGEQFRTLDFVKQTLSDAGFSLVTRDDDPRYYVPYHVHGHR